jgi:hypothetical protein
MSISPKSEPNGSSFGTPTPVPVPEDGMFGPAVKLNAVNAARPRHRLEPTPEPTPAPVQEPTAPVQTPSPTSAPVATPAYTEADLVLPHMRVPAGHPPISDNFGGFNRYTSGNAIRLNEFGGLDIGRGGNEGVVHEGHQVHIHTAMFLQAE